MKQPMSCAGRLVRPFMTVLAMCPSLKEELEAARARPLEGRMPVEFVHDLIARWVCATRDVDLGLRAGQLSCIGTGGALDYAFHTAPTLRESIRILQRFSKLCSDAIEVVVVEHEARVSIQLRGQAAVPRAFTDFLLATWYRNLLQPHLGSGAALECCFSYAPPVSIAVHQSVFGSSKLTFDAAFDGFTFADRILDHQLLSADGTLHDLHCGQLAMVECSIAHQQSLARCVRDMIAAEIGRARPSSHVVARKLRLSRRTLVRRLASEGTSFTLILDELRWRRALQLMENEQLSLQNIAEELGFSHVQAFHRSFKRWTGSTPARYRVMTERGTAAA